MSIDRWMGVPPELRPEAVEAGDPARRRIVREGPRNLEARPLDFRNPFPLAGSHAPRVDSGDAKRFNYYSDDRAAIGLPGGPECALVDRHGTLQAYTGAWGFALGEGAEAFDLRERFCGEDGLPIVRGEAAGDGAAFRFEWFASERRGTEEVDYPVLRNGSYKWTGRLQPRGRNLFFAMRVVRSGAEAAGQQPLLCAFAQRSALCAGAHYLNPRYAEPWEELAFEPDGGRRWLLIGCIRGERHLVAEARVRGGRIESTTLALPHWPQPVQKAPDRPAVAALLVRPESRAAELRFEWLVPGFPMPLSASAPLARARHERLRASTTSLWKRRRAAGMQVQIPEQKVRDAYSQALNHLDICAVKLELTEVLTPGPSGGYHCVVDRDAVDMIHAIALTGDFDRAERMMEYLHGCDIYQETSGMYLWLLGEHYRLSRRRAWAKQVLPLVRRCMSWLTTQWLRKGGENDGLLPSTETCDNELIHGHYVSYHLYALAGARHAVALAEAAGEAALAEGWAEFAKAFGEAVCRKLRELAASTGGVLTPGFEGFQAAPALIEKVWGDPSSKTAVRGGYGERGGADWHNVAAAFPIGVLAPDDPLVTSSLTRWRHTYLEGVFPYPFGGDYTRVHTYNTLNLSGTFLRRGEYYEALRDLYGALLHTSGTHASGEVVTTADRGGGAFTPHNWFSAKFVRFVRDLLVYEDGTALHLLGGLAPGWMREGDVVGIVRAPTHLGTISYRAEFGKAGGDIEVDWRATADARDLIIHLPPFVDGVSVRGDLGPAQQTHAGWRLPSETRRVELRWSACQPPDLSFESVVDAYLEDYRRRFSS